MIDVEIGRIGDFRLRGKQRRLEFRVYIEILDGVGRIVNRVVLRRGFLWLRIAIEGREKRQADDTDYDE